MPNEVRGDDGWASLDSAKAQSDGGIICNVFKGEKYYLRESNILLSTLVPKSKREKM